MLGYRSPQDLEDSLSQGVSCLCCIPESWWIGGFRPPTRKSTLERNLKWKILIVKWEIDLDAVDRCHTTMALVNKIKHKLKDYNFILE